MPRSWPRHHPRGSSARRCSRGRRAARRSPARLGGNRARRRRALLPLASSRRRARRSRRAGADTGDRRRPRRRALRHQAAPRPAPTTEAPVSHRWRRRRDRAQGEGPPVTRGVVLTVTSVRISDSQTATLRQLVADQVAELGTERGSGGQTDLPPRLGLALRRRLRRGSRGGRRDRRLQAGGAGAWGDDHGRSSSPPDAAGAGAGDDRRGRRRSASVACRWRGSRCIRASGSGRPGRRTPGCRRGTGGSPRRRRHRASAAKSGSAIWPRTTPTRPRCPSRRPFCLQRFSGLNPRRGMPPPCAAPRMKSKHLGGTAIEALDHGRSRRRHTDRGVDVVAVLHFRRGATFHRSPRS